MKLVLHLSHFNWAARREHFAEVLADVAAFADEGGLDGIAVADHLWQHPIMGGPEANCLEAYTTLAFLAPPPARSVCWRLPPAPTSGTPPCWPRS